MFRFLRRLLAGALFWVGHVAQSAWEGWTGRSLAAEQAQREEAEAAQRDAEADREDQAAHRATLEAIATDQLAATVELAEALKAATEPVRAPSVMDERRARQAAIRAAHESAVEVRSSRFVDVDDEPTVTYGVA